MHFWRARALFAAAAAAVVIAAAPSSASAQYDYTVGNVTAPAAADAGATITMTAIETAAPTSPSARYPWVRFFIAADAAMTSMVTELCTTWPSLAPGGSGPVSCTVQLPTWSPGTYYLGAVIDPEGFIAETDEQNNRSPAAAPIQIVFHRPDFTVSQVTAPSSADAGASITLSAVESSAAGASIPSYPARVGFYLATDAALTNRIAELCTPYPPLRTGTSQTVTCAATISAQVASGTYYVGAVIDPENLAAESDEQNNSSPTVPIQITHRPPDFSLAQLSSPTDATAGAPVELTVLESSAAGASGAVHAPWVTFYLARDAALQDPVTELCTTWPQLGTGTSRTVTCAAQLPPTLGAGTYYFGAVIDPRNQYVETDEANNMVAGGAIPVGPDLVVAGLTAPDAVADAAWITVVDTVTNRGSSAGPFSVGFFLSSDAAITSSDLLLGTRVVTDLAAGGTSASATQLQIPAGLSGRVYLGAIADTSLQVAEADEENNASPAIAMDVIADSTPPRIAVTGITDGEITSARPLAICYTATDPFLVSDEGVLDGIPFRGCASAWSEGMHSLAVTATDLAGLVTTLQASFTIDTAPPDLAVAWPTIGAVVGSLVSVIATVSDPWGVAAVEANGAPLGLAPDGTHRGAVALHASAPRVIVRASDLAGNTRSATVPIILSTPDPLALTLTAPAPAFVLDSSSVSVAGQVTGGAPPVTVRVNGIATSVALDGAFATMIPIAPGTVGISVAATDAAGATATASVTGTCTSSGVAGGAPGGTGGSGDGSTARPAVEVPHGAMRYLWDAAGNLTSVIDTATDIGNCGQLGTHCPDVISGDGSACRAGGCGAIVGGQFVDVWTDPGHCGASAMACLVPAHGAATCRYGMCGVQCDPGYARDGFECLELTSSPDHCGRVNHACEEPGASCILGSCRVPGVPAALAVNGVGAPGVVFRAPLATGIRVDGTRLDNVLAVQLEDWGPDTAGTDVAAPQYVGQLFAGVAFWRSSTSLVIPATVFQEAALEAAATPWAIGFRTRQWFKLRLFYEENGVPFDVLVDVAVSLDDQNPAERLAPVITGVSRLEVHTIPGGWGYDPATGFLRLFDPEWNCGFDLTLRKPPIAVLAAGDPVETDPLQTEFAVYGVTREGVFLQAGLNPLAVQRRLEEYPDLPWEVTLVFPYTDAAADYINIGLTSSADRTPVSCGPWRSDPQIAGLVLRGANLYADGRLSVSDLLGYPLPGVLGDPQFLEERVVIRPQRASRWGGILSTPISGILNAVSFVELSSPRGHAATPAPIQWRDVPVIESIGPRSFVAYDEVMTLTGRFFIGTETLAFTWADRREHLSRVETAPPGPGQFRVVDENHLELMLSSTAGTVPRSLAAACIGGAAFVDSFPGTRGFTLSNGVGTASITTNAVDPAGPVVTPATPLCAPDIGAGSGGHAPSPPDAPPMVGPSLPPHPFTPGGGDLTGRTRIQGEP